MIAVVLFANLREMGYTIHKTLLSSVTPQYSQRRCREEIVQAHTQVGTQAVVKAKPRGKEKTKWFGFNPSRQ